jgi:hypothetical protein
MSNTLKQRTGHNTRGRDRGRASSVSPVKMEGPRQQPRPKLRKGLRLRLRPAPQHRASTPRQTHVVLLLSV